MVCTVNSSLAMATLQETMELPWPSFLEGHCHGFFRVPGAQCAFQFLKDQCTALGSEAGSLVFLCMFL